MFIDTEALRQLPRDVIVHNILHWLDISSKTYRYSYTSYGYFTDDASRTIYRIFDMFLTLNWWSGNETFIKGAEQLTFYVELASMRPSYLQKLQNAAKSSVSTIVHISFTQFPRHRMKEISVDEQISYVEPISRLVSKIRIEYIVDTYIAQKLQSYNLNNVEIEPTFMVFDTTDTTEFIEMQQLLDNKYCKKVDFEIYSFTNKDQQSNVCKLMQRCAAKLNEVKFSSMPEYEPDAPFWQPNFWQFVGPRVTEIDLNRVKYENLWQYFDDHMLSYLKRLNSITFPSSSMDQLMKLLPIGVLNGASVKFPLPWKNVNGSNKQELNYQIIDQIMKVVGWADFGSYNVQIAGVDIRGLVLKQQTNGVIMVDSYVMKQNLAKSTYPQRDMRYDAGVEWNSFEEYIRKRVSLTTHL